MSYEKLKVKNDKSKNTSYSFPPSLSLGESSVNDSTLIIEINWKIIDQASARSEGKEENEIFFA